MRYVNKGKYIRLALQARIIFFLSFASKTKKNETRFGNQSKTVSKENEPKSK